MWCIDIYIEVETQLKIIPVLFYQIFSFFHVIYFQNFDRHLLTSFSADEMLLPRYRDWYIHFRGLKLKMEKEMFHPFFLSEICSCNHSKLSGTILLLPYLLRFIILCFSILFALKCWTFSSKIRKVFEEITLITDFQNPSSHQRNTKKESWDNTTVGRFLEVFRFYTRRDEENSTLIRYFSRQYLNNDAE